MLKDKPLPKGLTRIFNRFPIIFYRLGLGFIFGRRFLLLKHIGRKTGLLRSNVLEVVNYDEQKNRYYIASGWGEKSNWFKNIVENPNVEIQLGNTKLKASAKILEYDEASKIHYEYSVKHPKAYSILYKRILGEKLEVSREGSKKIAEHVPVIELSVCQ